MTDETAAQAWENTGKRLRILEADVTAALALLTVMTDDELDTLAQLVNRLEIRVLAEAENRPHG
jgi:indole-3-glycerol phosphate synthase